MKRTNFCT